MSERRINIIVTTNTVLPTAIERKIVKVGEVYIKEIVGGVDTTNFDGILSPLDDTVQKALDTIDDHDYDGGTW